MAECGTNAGYEQHRRRGEPRCDDCKAAHAEACRPAFERMIASLPQRGLMRCSTCRCLVPKGTYDHGCTRRG